MVNSVRGNFPSKYRRLGKSLSCPSCEEINDERSNLNITLNSQPNPRDSQFHILTECCAYDDLRVKYQNMSDSNLISFFQEVVEMRVQNGQD